MAKTLFPIKISSIPDDCLLEGRNVVSFSADFGKNSNPDFDGTLLVDFTGLAGQRQLTAIKGLFLSMDALQDDDGNNLALKITVKETGQVVYVGGPQGTNGVMNYFIPLFAVPTPNISIRRIGGGNSPGEQPVNFVFTNFEVQSFAWGVQTPSVG